jgi:hypothetical protein
VHLQISEGEPLLLSYGPLSNDFLLMDYGFMVPGNPHDRVTLRYDVDLLQVGWGVVWCGWGLEGGWRGAAGTFSLACCCRQTCTTCTLLCRDLAMWYRWQ